MLARVHTCKTIVLQKLKVKIGQVIKNIRKTEWEKIERNNVDTLPIHEKPQNSLKKKTIGMNPFNKLDLPK